MGSSSGKPIKTVKRRSKPSSSKLVKAECELLPEIKINSEDIHIGVQQKTSSMAL
jgi:hypothetical protein